jgi:hypothetical protein
MRKGFWAVLMTTFLVVFQTKNTVAEQREYLTPDLVVKMAESLAINDSLPVNPPIPWKEWRIESDNNIDSYFLHFNNLVSNNQMPVLVMQADRSKIFFCHFIFRIPKSQVVYPFYSDSPLIRPDSPIKIIVHDIGFWRYYHLLFDDVTKINQEDLEDFMANSQECFDKKYLSERE